MRFERVESLGPIVADAARVQVEPATIKSPTSLVRPDLIDRNVSDASDVLPRESLPEPELVDQFFTLCCSFFFFHIIPDWSTSIEM